MTRNDFRRCNWNDIHPLGALTSSSPLQSDNTPTRIKNELFKKLSLSRVITIFALKVDVCASVRESNVLLHKNLTVDTSLFVLSFSLRSVAKKRPKTTYCEPIQQQNNQELAV